MKRALIAVDVQLDFLPDGPLGVPDGDKILQPLTDLIEHRGTDVIVFSQDWHPVNHFSFSDNPEYKDGSWPMHCVQGTLGAEIQMGVLDAARATGKPIVFVRKGVLPDHEAYSAFDGRVTDTENVDFDLKGLNLLVALKQLEVAQVIVGGLALDYCVRATAISSAPDFDTFVSLDATRPVALETGLRTVADLSTYGLNFW